MNEGKAMEIFEKQPELAAVFNRLGIEQNANNLDHFMVLMEALQTFAERERNYNGVWRQYGALSNLLRSATKIDRLMEVWWHNPDGAGALHKDGLDDAVDLINYAVFFMRTARDGNLFGSPRDRSLEKEAIAGNVIKLMADNTEVRQYLPVNFGENGRPLPGTTYYVCADD